MTIIPQDILDEQAVNSTVSNFLSTFKVGSALRKSGAYKEKGIGVMTLFNYLLCLIFSGRSMYMDMLTGSFKESFSKNSVYRLLNNSKIHWKKFTTLISAQIINAFMKPLTDDKRNDVFIIDDSLFEKNRSKKTELLSNVFDHCSMTYKRGFRLLTLGWSDGNSFIPVNSCLLASSKTDNRYCDAQKFDKRSIAGKRRKQAQCKATDVMLDLLDSAKAAGLSAKYVLFDSWFSSPIAIQKIKNRGFDTIAMVKKSSKITYAFEGERLNIKQIYSRCKKRRGRSKYLLSVTVMVGKEDPKEGLVSIPAKLVCVRNKSKKKDWLVLISTDTRLTEEEIIQIYGKRWDIEVFFKVCKSYLKLSKECRSISYDALTAHTAIVFVRYMLLSVEKRTNEDDRSIGELFYRITDELADLTFSASFSIIMQALMDTMIEMFHISEDEMKKFMENFIGKLPKYLQSALIPSISA
jgi:hypothetical protein